jgi:hypothetical protein
MIDIQKLIDTDMPSIVITETTRELAKRYGIRGNVRASIGKFWTDREYKIYRTKVLSTPLP